MRKRAGIALATAVVAVSSLGACGSGSGGGTSASGKSEACQGKDHKGNEYNRCDLMGQDQVYVEATIGRSFEIEGFGTPKVGQTVKVVCYDSTGVHGSFGIVIPQGRERSDGKWTLGRIDDKPFAYVGQIIGAAFEDAPGRSKKLKDELRQKLSDKFDGTDYVDSCDDGRVIISDARKAMLLQQ